MERKPKNYEFTTWRAGIEFSELIWSDCNQVNLYRSVSVKLIGDLDPIYVCSGTFENEEGAQLENVRMVVHPSLLTFHCGTAVINAEKARGKKKKNSFTFVLHTYIYIQILFVVCHPIDFSTSTTSYGCAALFLWSVPVLHNHQQADFMIWPLWLYRWSLLLSK